MSRHRKPTTIAATIAQFRNGAPPRIKENEAIMKYVMKFSETGLLTGISLVRDIEDLPESERGEATEALRVEFDVAVMTNFLNAVNALVDSAESPQARRPTPLHCRLSARSRSHRTASLPRSRTWFGFRPGPTTSF